jgi:PAS domain S-box-containing protein
MTLRLRTLLVISSTLIALVVVLYLVSQAILLGSYLQLEASDTQENVTRALNSFQEDLTTLGRSASDYATWDETYTYAADHNQAYIDANYVDSVFTNLRLSLVLIIDQDGQLLYGHQFDLVAGQTVSLSKELTGFAPDNPLLRATADLTPVIGLMSLGSESMLIASQPILASDGSGPSHGRLIFSRELDQAEVQRLASSLRLTLNFIRLDQNPLPANFQAVRSQITDAQPIAVRPLNENVIAGYTLMSDIADRPLLALSVERERSIYHQAQQSLLYLVGAVLSAGVIFGIVILLTLEATVLRRLTRLSGEVSHVGRVGSPSLRTKISGNDELAKLGESINRMLETLETSQEQLRRREREATTLLDSMPDYAFLKDLNGVYITANLNFCNVVGVARPDLTGLTDFDLYPRATAEAYRVDDQRVLESGQSFSTGEETRRDGERQITTSTRKSPLRDGEGQIIGLIGWVTDITELKQVEAFAYSASHDLRAPLQNIDGFSWVLSEKFSEQLGVEGRQHLDRIHAAIQRMKDLIDDLLRLSQTTYSEMHREPVDLSELVRSLAAEIQQRNPARVVEWVVADHLTANGDARLLRVALENLLSNAFKFTRRQPKPRIEFDRVVGADGRTEYCVRDNGAGFDMAQADKLFVPFKRLHAQSEFAGTGVGLATVQRIIQRHGGHVRAESVLGHGASFYFTL